MRILNSVSNRKKSDQDGFTLLEAVIAILVVTIGLLGTAGAITYALEYSSVSKNSGNAKLLITSMIEQIESLRNTRRLEFIQIANVGEVDNTGCPNPFNGFSTDYKEVSMGKGPDGVDGTDDDLLDPGPDTVYGTADDFNNPTLARSGYWRRVTVTDISKTVKKVEIKIRYISSAGKIGELTGICYLNNNNRLTN